MSYDVVVIGGGIGGLTVAALLSSRGVDVCVLERQSQVGGCIGRIEFSGYDFEPGMGIYSAWEPGGIYDRIFPELPVESPAASLITSEYVVRLGTDIQLHRDDESFFNHLRATFPEDAAPGQEFYRLVNRVNQAWSKQAQPHRSALSKSLGTLRTRLGFDKVLINAKSQTTASFLTNTSPRFQRFIDAQLRTLLHTGIDRCAFLPASLALSTLRSNQYSLVGGTPVLAERLADAIKLAGGTVRLNSPVLRLAYNESGDAIGVDLLNGETVIAKQAIVSNLTSWDTYGRLVGLKRTPTEIKNRLATIQGSGVYVIYAAVDEAAAGRLPASSFLVAEHESSTDEDLSNEFTVTIGKPGMDGKCPATIKTSTDVMPWFTYQTSENDYVELDQLFLTRFWERIHKGLPELGAGIEVIETGNPRTYYEQTRRKLGMVLGIENIPGSIQPESGHATAIPNLFAIGDTVTMGFGVSAVAQAALALADQLTK